MNEQAVLYALSTPAQTCAALAALVGALGLYRAQASRTEQVQTEATIRHLLVSSGVPAGEATLLPTENATNRARTIAAAQPQNLDLAAAVNKWDRYDPSFRPSNRLLILFGAWNLGVILLSLGGFTVVPALTGRVWASALLWGLAIGTVITTGAMLLEANDSLSKWLATKRLARVVHWLERGPRP